MTRPGAAMLIGPWRYSKSGYASVHACALSRSFSAASWARPTVQPWPRNVHCSIAAGSATGSGSASARAASAAAAAAAPGWTLSRRSESAPVAKRVCTIERSSANGSAIAASAPVPTGVPAPPVIATERAARPRLSACTTSVVVPERESATSTSYRRPTGSSEAANASVQPCPARSRSAA